MANNMLRCIRAKLPPMIENGAVKWTPCKKMTMKNIDRNLSTSAYFSNAKSSFHNFLKNEKPAKAFAKKFEAPELKPNLIMMDDKTSISKSILKWLNLAAAWAIFMSLWCGVKIRDYLLIVKKKNEK